jgi:hypothetical protein
MKSKPKVTVDLGGRLQIIGENFRWQTVAEVFPASKKRAREIMKSRGLKSAWLYDGFCREFLD